MYMLYGVGDAYFHLLHMFSRIKHTLLINE